MSESGRNCLDATEQYALGTYLREHVDDLYNRPLAEIARSASEYLGFAVKPSNVKTMAVAAKVKLAPASPRRGPRSRDRIRRLGRMFIAHLEDHGDEVPDELYYMVHAKKRPPEDESEDNRPLLRDRPPEQPEHARKSLG